MFNLLQFSNPSKYKNIFVFKTSSFIYLVIYFVITLSFYFYSLFILPPYLLCSYYIYILYKIYIYSHSNDDVTTFIRKLLLNPKNPNVFCIFVKTDTHYKFIWSVFLCNLDPPKVSSIRHSMKVMYIFG